MSGYTLTQHNHNTSVYGCFESNVFRNASSGKMITHTNSLHPYKINEGEVPNDGRGVFKTGPSPKRYTSCIRVEVFLLTTPRSYKKDRRDRVLPMSSERIRRK